MWGKKTLIKHCHAHFSCHKKTKAIRVLPICLSRSAASSGVALGSTPGSVKLVLRSVPITNINRTPPMTGITGVNCSARNGQLIGQEEMLGETEISKQQAASCLATNA